MNIGMNHFRTDVNAQLADDENPQAISYDRQGNDDAHKQKPFVVRTKKQVTSDKAGDEERKARLYAAALGCNFQIDSGQLKESSLAEKWRAG